jgi:isochorismate synthase EntC
MELVGERELWLSILRQGSMSNKQVQPLVNKIMIRCTDSENERFYTARNDMHQCIACICCNVLVKKKKKNKKKKKKKKKHANITRFSRILPDLPKTCKRYLLFSNNFFLYSTTVCHVVNTGSCPITEIR